MSVLRGHFYTGVYRLRLGRAAYAESASAAKSALALDT